MRATTEVFYVFTGEGCVTDTDGTKHEFGPGDTVILPKGWAGRWDIYKLVHKVWVVHDHPDVEGASTPVRAVIATPETFASAELSPEGTRGEQVIGSPVFSARNVYDLGTTSVGCWTSKPGSYQVTTQATTESFHLLEGLIFVTNTDGRAQRCVAGDTIITPKGWSGHWDILEPLRTLRVVYTHT